jgi:hypothetical protein
MQSMDAHVKPKVTSLMIPTSHTIRGSEYSYRYQNACFRQISQCARPMHPVLVPCTRCRTPTPASLHVSLIDFDIRAADRLRTAQAHMH